MQELIKAKLKEMRVNKSMSNATYYQNIKDWSWNLLSNLIDALNETGPFKGENSLQTFLNFFSWGDYKTNPTNWVTIPKNDIEALDIFLEVEYGVDNENERKKIIKDILLFLKAYKTGDFEKEGFSYDDEIQDISQYKYLDRLGTYDRDFGLDAIVVSNRINIGDNPEYMLKEMRVNKPVSKSDMLDKMMDTEDFHGESSYLDQFSYYRNFDDWYHDKVDEDDDDFNPEIISLAKIYYTWEKNGDIIVTEAEDSEELGIINLTKTYKRLITYGMGYNDVRIILTTF